MNKNFRVIELKSWQRRELFQSFKNFDSANFDVLFEPEILPLFRFAKARGESFFLLTLFAISKAMNAVPEMRQRFLSDDAIAEYEIVHPSVPLISAAAKPVVENVRRGNASGQLRDADIANCFAASCVPWFCASAYSPAVFCKNQDIHVLTWFKMSAAGTVLISCRFNHCFTDGLHVSRFFNAIAQNFAAPETL